jgi:two-component system, sensor histidine kinase and response regulator
MISSSEPSGKLTILVVEDVPDDIAVLDGILREDYHVRVATGGEAALKIAGSNPSPDLILLDVMMPDMDGMEVCRRLKQDPTTSKIPMIFVTAKDAVADESLGFAVGAVDYIVKPVNPFLVKARVKAHLELKQARADLERQNEILLQNARLREEVEAINRHDLKNPLMIIMNIPGVLLQAAKLSESDKKLLRMVETAGRQILEMINRTIDLYKMEMGTYVVNSASVDVARLIEQIMTAFHEISESKRLSVDVTFRGSPLSQAEAFRVMGEELLVYSVLANLVKNAFEASPRDGRVSIALEERDVASIAIHNLGAIPKQIRSRFSQKFTTAGKDGGTGLGVYSAQLMVRTMKGDLRFESSEEKGTTITITLPRA